MHYQTLNHSYVVPVHSINQIVHRGSRPFPSRANTGYAPYRPYRQHLNGENGRGPGS